MNNKREYFWGLLSRFAPQGLYFITTMVLSRFLTPDDFGMIGVLSIIFTVANILLDSGLGGSLIKEETISKLDCSTIAAFNVIVSLIIYLLLFAFSGSIENYFGIPELSSVVKVISIVFPITALGIVPSSILKRSLAFNKIFMCSIIGVTIASVASVLIAIMGGGVYALVFYQIVVNAVTVSCKYVFSKYKISFKFCLENFKKLIPFGLYTSIVSIVDTIYENLLTAMTGKYLNVRKAGYLYQAKRSEETLSSSLAVALGVVAFPVLTKIKSNVIKFTQESLNTFRVITLLVFPLQITVSIFSKEIITILFGQKWEPAAPYLEVLMIAGMFILMEQLLLSFIKAFGKVDRLMYITLLKRIIGISLLFVTLKVEPDYLVYAYLLSTIIGFSMNLLVFVRITHVNSFMYFKQIMISVVPMLFYFLTFRYLKLIGTDLIVLIISSILFLMLDYFVYIKIFGVNIMKLINNIRYVRK